MTRRLRTAVIGGGLIAQAVHLPNLVRLQDLFEIVAIVDASPTVAEGLAARYGDAVSYADWRQMLDRERLDAIVVCSPHATHASITLAALCRGLNVFVEKPLCISPNDAKAICAARDETGLVVQVGYMKRFEPAYQRFLDGLPTSADQLRLVTVVTYDPSMAREPFVPWNQMIHSNDIPVPALEEQRDSEFRQVQEAVGFDDDRTVRAYSHTFLACLIHDVNLIHGALDRLGVDGPLLPAAAADWAAGDGGTIVVQLPNGAPWHSSWVLLPGLMEFRERATLHFADAIHEISFPSPYDQRAGVAHSITSARNSKPVHRDRAITGDAFAAELSHFHDCVVERAPCRCPPEQAARDIELLRDLFVSGATANQTLSQGASAR